jgi:hypothetical protein
LMSGVTNGYGVARNVFSFILLPFRLLLQPQLFFPEAGLSFIYLLGLPFVAAMLAKDKTFRRLSLILLGFMVIWFLQSQVLRYLVPVIPLATVLTMWAMDYYIVRKDMTGFAVWMLSLALVVQGWIYMDSVISQRGVLPQTANARITYLAARLAPYPAIQWLNSHLGSHYSLYQLYAENMFYYAEGRVIGGWYGKYRYSIVANAMSGGRKLYHTLEALRVGYFLYTTDRFASVIVRDHFFDEHFKLVYARPGIYLYKLATQPLQEHFGPDVLDNSTFSVDPKTGQVVGWERVGVYDTPSGGRSRALVVSSPQSLYQVLVVGGGGHRDAVMRGAVYLVSGYIRSFAPDAALWMQFSWMDDNSRFVYADVGGEPATTEWKRFVEYITIPSFSASATFYIGESNGPVWIRDLTMQRIGYSPTQPIGHPDSSSTVPSTNSLHRTITRMRQLDRPPSSSVAGTI